MKRNYTKEVRWNQNEIKLGDKKKKKEEKEKNRRRKRKKNKENLRKVKKGRKNSIIFFVKWIVSIDKILFFKLKLDKFWTRYATLFFPWISFSSFSCLQHRVSCFSFKFKRSSFVSNLCCKSRDQALIDCLFSRA